AGLHIGLGLVFAFMPSLTFLIGLSAFLLGIYWALTDSVTGMNRGLLAAAYLCGLELVLRLSRSGLPHEFVKYAVALILLIMWIRSGMRIHPGILLYFLLLLPAALLSNGGTLEETRQLISANLSGPLCLTVSSLFLYKRKIPINHFVGVLRWLLYPIIALVTILIVKTPDLAEIDFGYGSNFQTSIYGPNQISSILGLGIIIIGLGLLLKLRLFKWSWVGLIIGGLFLFRGLLTFSRGGIVTAFVVLALVYLLILFSSKVSVGLRVRVILFVAAGIFVVYNLFQYTNDLTENALFNRYAGIREGRQLTAETYTSGRSKIIELDWDIFKENWVLGVGVGMGKAARAEEGYEIIAHVEFTRMLAEHGLAGVISLLILIFLPVLRFVREVILLNRIFLVAGILFCFSFMLHSATRIAAPMFMYGFVFIQLITQMGNDKSSTRSFARVKHQAVVNPNV
ncbi:MAG TPA: O-antigen ligase family protein, partial [Cyclobacteriaceae bacterium]|nr:O-antigen ligase family protein [Cyclobacteriaceae bacterium]